MSALLKIMSIAVLAFLLGAAVLFGVVSGPLGAIFSPVASLFGWFYFPVALIGVALMWRLYSPVLTPFPRRAGFIAAGGLLGAITMQVIGVREEGASIPWTLGYLLGGGLAGAVGAYLVTRWRGHDA